MRIRSTGPAGAAGPAAVATVTAALALCLVLPATALAKGKADADKGDAPESTEAAPKLAASLEFLLGLGSTFETEPDGKDVVESDGKATLGIVPGFDKMLGRNFGIGGEYMFVWAGSDEKGAPDERSLIMSPHLRARMTFPIWQGLSFDGLLGLGPTIWVGNDKAAKGEPTRDTRFGWSLRFNFGAGWKFNDSVAAFTAVGYYTTTTYGDDYTLNLNTVPVSLGLRSSF
jgi:hypothetical protein